VTLVGSREYRRLSDVRPLMGDPFLYLAATTRYSFYDSLIISAALKAGCSVLYSEDMQHGQKIHNLTIVNPFKKT